MAVAPVVQNNPAVNRSESPGRKNPISNPVSANRTTNTPAAPRLESHDVALNGFMHPPYFDISVVFLQHCSLTGAGNLAAAA